MGSSSTGSDSEIETKIKFNSRKKFKYCLICQNPGSLVKGSEKSFKTLVECMKLRENLTKEVNFDLHTTVTAIQEGNEFQLGSWHKNCYSSFTSKRNIETLRQKIKKHRQIEDFQATTEASSITSVSLRKSSFEVLKCVFCQKRSNTKTLSQVLTINTENKIKIIAQNSPTIFERIGSNDLIAMEVKYHASCFNPAWMKGKKSTKGIKEELIKQDEGLIKLYKILEKGFVKRKGYGITSIYKKYGELGGFKSKRQLLRLIQTYFGNKIEVIKSKQSNRSDIIIPKITKDETIHSHIEETPTHSYIPVLCGTSELSQIHKICSDIRSEMDNIPDFKQYNNLDTKTYKKYIPEALVWIVRLLISDGGEEDETQTLSICQDIIYNYSKCKKLTPKHIGLGIMVHQETRSKKIIDKLHTCGHCMSYKDILRLRNTIAQEEIHRYIENDNIVVPRQLLPNIFVQFAADNIDILEETLDKSPTFHGTQIVAFQGGPPNNNIDRDVELLPYKVKLDIPESFHLLRRVNCNKSTKPAPSIKNKEMIFNVTPVKNYIRHHNMSWILCRMSHNPVNKEEIVVPQWSGFNKLLAQKDTNTTSYGYLPLLPHVASEYDTVWTVMKRCESIANKLNIKYVVITFDQAIYFKAKEIQWLKNHECKNYVLRLGGFHIMLNFLKVIGQHMENSGLKDMWLESGLYGEATVTGIFNGKKWNKAIRAHKLTYESLMRILILLFEKWLMDCKSDCIHSINFARLLSNDLCNDIRSKSSLENFKIMVAKFEEISDIFMEFVNSQSVTFRFWFSYINLVEILLEFLYSERTGNWELHLNSFRKMLPWFFTYDHTNYSRWGAVYLADMLNLPHNAPEIQREFDAGNFVVKRLPGKFNTISVDQAIEHVNKSAKDAGGIVGLTKNSTRLDEWFLSFNEIGLMIDSFKSSLKATNPPDPVSQNIEIGAQRILIDEQAVIILQEQFSRFKVLTRDEDALICISTNEIIDKNVEQFLLTASEKGEESLRKFIQIIDTNDFYKPLKKQNLQRMQSLRPKLEKSNKIKDSQGGQTVLQQILTAKEMGRNISHSNIFKHELTSYPMALCVNGVLSTPSNKSILGNIIETFSTTVKSLPECDSRTCLILDGMSVVQSLGKPAKAKTFKDYATIFNAVIFRNKYNAQRIDVVFDQYIEKSIKNSTRIKRGSGPTINRIIDTTDTPLPQQWHLFIHSIFNKRQLTSFLSDQLIAYSNTTNIQFATSGGFASVLDYKTNFQLEDDLLSSNHEEADTRILLHILSAKKAGYRRCIVDCKDTDVLVLLAHFKDYLTPEVWMKVGSHDAIRFISVHEINMSPSLLKTLPAFHALTGCDTTSQFNGLGKKVCWKIYLSYYKLLEGVGVEDFNDILFNKMHNFVLKLYTNNTDISSINDLRSILAISKTIDKLPPTKNSLKQHCLRSYYQTKIWLSSLEPQPILPNILEYGWMIERGQIVPVLQTQPALPEDLSILATCRCKKDCTSKVCSCKKKNVTCIGSCYCMGQKSCKNSIANRSQHSVNISIEEDSESDN